MRLSLIAAALAATSLFTASAHAASPVDIGLTAGTLGYGPQIGIVIVPNKYDVRVNLGMFNYNYNTTSNGVYYNGHLKLQNLGVMGDWHPFESSFRVTGGVFYNDNKFDLTGQSTGGNYTFNGNTYTAAQVGTATANVDFNKVAPYIGIGWGDNSETAGFHFTSDIGVMYQGKPNATLTATGAATNAALAADVAAAQTTLQNDLNGFQWYPVVQVGANYRF